jgi:hypothetical protein
MRNRRKCPPPIGRDHYNPGVTVTELAEGTAAYNVGYLTAEFGIPILGLVLLIVGLRQRSRRRRQPPGYPPPGPSPYGYPPPSGPIGSGYPYSPGPPAPPGPPPYYPPGYPAPRPPGSSGTALIVVGSILLGLGVLGILGGAANVVSQHRGSAQSADVGQCVGAFAMQHNDLSPKPQDCDKPSSTWEVAAKGDRSANCPDGKREDSDYAVLFDGTTTLCLLLNLKQDQCYTMAGGAKDPAFVANSCDSSMPGIKVVKRVDGSTDTTLCPTETKAVSYPSPARLYCLERLEN